ncbi:hypothetical protein TH25_01605 [Thalassospira profundimaris]|uniref:Uncharacterized protein n=2 Tax=Thalassospira profundimaris TaxID=502049 RepID=A0A367XKA9_9PROT|nr:hypothetical protein TH25_01605 [Thalassospira profundimaris]
MGISSAIFYDNYVFCGLTVAALIYAFINQRSNFNLIFLYIIATYSSYNIMVKPIHDFNIVIARNYIYHQKAVGPLSWIDIIFFAFLVFYLAKTLITRKNITRINEFDEYGFIKFCFFRDVSLSLLSLLSFIVFLGHDDPANQAQWINQIRPYRGYLYMITIVLILRDNCKVNNPTKLLLFFCMIDLINYSSGLISSFLFQNYTWKRYFLNTTVIDQDNIYYLSITYLAYFFLYILYPKRFENKKLLATSGLISILVFVNFYKYIYVIILVIMISYTLINFIYRKISVHAYIMIAISIVFASAFLSLFLNSTAIETRKGQLNDYFIAVENYGYYAQLFGIGDGGYYNIISDTSNDGGEMKEIDQEKNPFIRTAIQFTLIQIIKPVGIIGLLVFVLASIAFSYKFLIRFSSGSILEFSLLSFPLVHFLLEFMFLSPTPLNAVVGGKCFLLSYALRQHIRESKQRTM